MLITILCLEQLTIRYMIWRALRRILVSVDFCGIDCVLMGPFSLAASAILLLLFGSSALCLWGSDSLLCICGHHSGVVLDGTGGYEHACILWQGHHEFALPMCGGFCVGAKVWPGAAMLSGIKTMLAGSPPLCGGD